MLFPLEKPRFDISFAMGDLEFVQTVASRYKNLCGEVYSRLATSDEVSRSFPEWYKEKEYVRKKNALLKSMNELEAYLNAKASELRR